MKFRITKTNFSLIKEIFENNDCVEIELEPIIATATQAIYEQQIKQESCHQGYHFGYKEGYYARKNNEWKCGCGCGGNNCYLRFCDKFCQLYNK